MTSLADLRLRPSTEADVPAIRDIYAHHVLHGLASFETDPPDAAEIARRRADALARGYPHLVAEIAGEVAGYAYAGPYRTRPAYRFTAEDSVYVRHGAEGRGVGRALLAELLVGCAGAGVRQVVAVIGDSANHGSIGLHRALGFREVGVLEAVGFKFGRWVDSVLMQKSLG
jgi:phosphinothricin acetyltransferase